MPAPEATSCAKPRSLWATACTGQHESGHALPNLDSLGVSGLEPIHHIHAFLAPKDGAPVSDLRVPRNMASFSLERKLLLETTFQHEKNWL